MTLEQLIEELFPARVPQRAIASDEFFV